MQLGALAINSKVVAKAVLLNATGEILLLRRSQTDTRRPGQWDFPGGSVEKDEMIETACAREITEESGIVVGGQQLELFWADADVIVVEADGSMINVVWLFYCAHVGVAKPVLSYEHDLFQWMDPAEALRQIIYQRHVDMLSYAITHKLFGP